jgi:hypothetical protein
VNDGDVEQFVLVVDRRNHAGTVFEDAVNA